MLSFKEAKIVTLDATQYEFYEKWYYTVIREILAFFPVKDDFSELASRIIPSITESEARKAVETLEHLGLISKDADGFYRQSNPLIMADRDASSLAVDNFIISNIDLAREAVDRFSKEERKLSATTISVSKETYKKIIDELREFRRHIMTLAQNDPNPERTYQFNFQVFPVSKPFPERKPQ